MRRLLFTFTLGSVVVLATVASAKEPRRISGLTPLDNNTTTTVSSPNVTSVTEPTSTPGSTTPPVATPWEPVTANLAGMASECGNISFVSVRPDRDMVTVSVAQHGLWASVDGSDTWEALGQGSGSAVITNRGSAIVYDPEHPDTFWESGIYNGGGVYRTDDNGVTFQQLGDAVHSEAVSVDLTDPERKVLLSGTHERGALFRSTDGGETWTDLSRLLPPGIGFAHGPHVIDATTHLLGSGLSGEGGVFRTTDGGATWERVFTGPVAGRPFVASDGSLYWVLESTGGVIKSTDEGLTWTQVARDGTVLPSAWNLVELPDGRHAAIGNGSVVVSEDAGVSWRAVGSSLPFKPNGFAYSPLRNAFFIWYFTCDTGTDNAVPEDAIMSMSFDYTAQ